MSQEISRSSLLPPSPSSGKLTPGRDKNSLAVRQAQIGIASWVEDQQIAPTPSGPPHIGTRDALVKENTSLFNSLQAASAELEAGRAVAIALTAAREKDAHESAERYAKLTKNTEEVSAELAAVQSAAATEQRRLQEALSNCQAELTACSERLFRTHETLGLTADRARVLESSQSRLQIDLDGTLSTLEEAQWRAAKQKAEAEVASARREEELLGMLRVSQANTAKLQADLGVAQDSARTFEEQLTRVKVAHERETLELRHEIERMQDRLITAEANRLDPKALTNLAFTSGAVVRPTGVVARPAMGNPKLVVARVGSSLAPTVNIGGMRPTGMRGRLQSMVPPSQMASPAPTCM